jgi:protein-ribulosamine 3-kinase
LVVHDLESLTSFYAGLPQLRSVTGFFSHGASAWARSFRIDAEFSDGSHQSYFMKVVLPLFWIGSSSDSKVWQVSVGHHGREALRGEFEGTSAIYSITPDFVPKPIAWGTYKSSPDTHFYLCKFYDLVEELPDPAVFCARLAELHQSHSSPNGKYGFHVVTYNGDLPQENGYADSWEEFFANGLRHMFKLNLERGGPSEELERLLPDIFGKVIPRLLRPLETGGNSIKPSIVHGDLWCGNAAVDQKTDNPLIFDPSCFWAHNECMISLFLHILS